MGLNLTVDGAKLLSQSEEMRQFDSEKLATLADQTGGSTDLDPRTLLTLFLLFGESGRFRLAGGECCDSETG